MRFLLNVAAAVLLSLPAVHGVAFGHEEHNPSTIKGEKIDLFERNHAFAGSILDNPVMGVFDHEPFGANVQIRRGEKTLHLSLVDKDDKYAGIVTEQRTNEAGDEQTVSTNIAFVGVKKTGDASGEITLNIDGADVVVTVVGEKFEHNHFHGPTFSAKLNGKEISFKFTGESCFGYSANIAMMILGSAAHLSK